MLILSIPMFASSCLFALAWVLTLSGLITTSTLNLIIYPAALVSGSMLIAIVVIALTIQKQDEAKDDGDIPIRSFRGLD